MNVVKDERRYRVQAQADGFKWTWLAAILGLFLVLLYVIWCVLTHHSIIFYGS